VTSPLDQTTPARVRLRDRVLSSGAWTLGSYGLDLSIKLCSNLILTRLLFPEAFGAVAAATALMAGLVLISDFGVRAVVIQSPRGNDVGFLHSAWVFQLSRGIAVWIGLVCLCVLISVPSIRGLLPTGSVFANPTLPLITVTLGFGIVLGGAESMCIPLNVRHINYRPVVVFDLISKTLSLPIMLIWAWTAPSVWALVGGSLAGAAFRTVLSHVLVPGPRMNLKWEKDHFREIVRFGRWIAVSSFASFVSQQCDVILLGIFMPGSTLGLYSIAKLLTGTGEGLLDRLNASLALPILGEVIRKDPSNLRNRYYRFRLPIDLVAGLLSGGLFVAGAFIVSFLYDSRYQQAGLMLQILALGTVSYPFSIIANAFIATGDTHIFALTSIVKAASLIASMTIGYLAFGILGAIGGVALHRLIPSLVIILLAHQRNWIGIWHELRVIPAFVAGILIGQVLVLIASGLGIHNIHQLLYF
jgi:O-antigen/teichoic acid export membrane protein